MKISEFIKQSIDEILKGLKNAESDRYKFGLHKDMGVEFDIAVTNGFSSNAKAGIEILSIGTSVKARVSGENVHRLRFRIYAKGKKMIFKSDIFKKANG
jgi:hypothetical protein